MMELFMSLGSEEIIQAALVTCLPAGRFCLSSVEFILSEAEGSHSCTSTILFSKKFCDQFFNTRYIVLCRSDKFTCSFFIFGNIITVILFNSSEIQSGVDR